jgi:hypothetical protein
MKKYKYTFWNGMVEVPNGEYVKEKEACIYLQHWINNQSKLEKIIESQQLDWYELHTKYGDERILSLLLTAGILFSVFFNIFQFLIK